MEDTYNYHTVLWTDGAVVNISSVMRMQVSHLQEVNFNVGLDDAVMVGNHRLMVTDIIRYLLFTLMQPDY